MKLACFLCDWKNIDGADLRTVMVDFISDEGNISHKTRHMMACQNCRSRVFFCSLHSIPHAVFIDSSHACTQCIREESRLRQKNSQDRLHRLFHEFMRNFSKKENHAFFTLVRRAIGDAGGIHTSTMMCFIVAVVAKVYSWQITVDEVLEIVKQQGTLMALLPQRNKKYKTIINPS